MKHPAAKTGALPWWGSKHPQRGDRLGQWVVDKLPRRGCYVEPFAGMLGILLQRAPANLEVVNDLDGRVVNWWRVVRDQPDELAELVMHTPTARAEFDWALSAQWNTELSDVERARALTVVLWQSAATTHWRRDRYTHHSQRHTYRAQNMPPMFAALADRMRDVHIEQKDALEVLERHTQSPDTLVYCDPPYRQGERYLWDTRAYPASRQWERSKYPQADTHEGTLWDQLEDMLLEATCDIALSGNAGDYPKLIEAGWTEHTRQRTTNTAPGNWRADTLDEATEALLVNYPIYEAQPQLEYDT